VFETMMIISSPLSDSYVYIEGEKEWQVPNQLVAGGVLALYLRVQRERGRGGGCGCRVEFEGARSDFNLNDGIFFCVVCFHNIAQASCTNSL
jgi:hypothetical protein